ncbi:MAG: glycosyltransferase [Bacteroidetes bacterium]|nr:glycosyltransferase [Bacteroidota bacterium]
MKILIVCSGNPKNGKFDFNTHQSFVEEQMSALNKTGVKTELFLIKGRGVFGYLKNLPLLRQSIGLSECSAIHAHFGLSGMLAVLQRKVPVIITFHGTDIRQFPLNVISSVASCFSKWNIFVSELLKEKLLLRHKKKYSIIPCGVDFEKFFPMDKTRARQLLRLVEDKFYILFSSAFDNPIKNYQLARKAVQPINNAVLLELKDYTREEVNLLFNACDLLLITSCFESSSQVAKEAMACNCPIVSTDVGIVGKLISNQDGCYLTSYDPSEVQNKIESAINFRKRTNGRSKVLNFNNNLIAEKLLHVYGQVCF